MVLLITDLSGYSRGVKLIFTEGHFYIMAAIKGPVETKTVQMLLLLNILLNNCLYLSYKYCMCICIDVKIYVIALCYFNINPFNLSG